MAGGIPWPPPTFGPPVSFAPPPGPQKCRPKNPGLGPGPVCFDSGSHLGTFPMSLNAQVGYGHFGLDFNMRPTFEFGAAGSTNLALSFKNVNVPIGSVEARIESCTGLFLALRLQGSAARDIDIRTPEAPLGEFTLGESDPRLWDGRNFQWWTLDNDIGYRITPCCSALAGLRRDKLSVDLTNPKDAAGEGLNFNIGTPGAFDFALTMNCNFSSELWIPYLGVEFTGQRYRAAFLWGPYAWTDMKVPYRYYLSIVTPQPVLSQQVWFDYDYQCKAVKTANLLDYTFEYEVAAGPSFACRLWTSGNWMQLSWKGRFDGFFGMQLINPSAQPPSRPVEYVAIPGESGVDAANYTKWMISGGIGTVFFF